MRRAAAIAALALLALAGCGPAPQPVVSITTPGKCILPADQMRRAHPDMLRHQRTLTVHEGRRGMPASLSGCVDCHAPHAATAASGSAPDTAGTATVLAAVNSPGGFCDSCHAYAAVKLDCFECHASTPGRSTGTARQAAAALPRNVQ
jgi:hypothetical protein